MDGDDGMQELAKYAVTLATDSYIAGMKAKDTTYERKYRLLVGAVAEAMGDLNEGHTDAAKRTLADAVLAASRDEFPGFSDRDIIAGLTTPAVRC